MLPPPPLPLPPLPPLPLPLPLPPLTGNFPSDLAGWSRSILGGTEPQTGTIAVSNGVLSLSEGNSFRVGISEAFTVPTTPTAVQITFEAPHFDSTSVGKIRDAFEIAVLDATGRPLALPIGADRDASFNWSEQLAPLFAPGTSGNTTTATINLSALPVGTAAQLLLRLVNNDTDTGTFVRVTRVDFMAATETAPAGIPAAAARVHAVGAPNFTALTDVTPSATVDYGRTTLNEDRTILTTDARIRNTGSYAFSGRTVLVIGNLSDASVGVLNPDGYTADGRAYFDITPEMNGVALAAGQSTNARPLQFTNPNRERFTYDLQVLAELNHNPVFTGAPVTLTSVGQSYSYGAKAIDADGPTVSYSIVAGPTGMTINAATGAVNWVPTAGDVGNHSVRIRATDPLGGTVEQSYTLTVRDDIPNRPPIITSTPNTDATVAGSWTASTVRTGSTPTGIAAGNFGTGQPSVVTVNSGDQTVSVAGGIGAGQFLPANNFHVGEPAPNGRVLQSGTPIDIGLPKTVPGGDSQSIDAPQQADLNGDGTLDFVTPGRSIVANGAAGGLVYSQFVSVTLNNGDGTFATPQILSIENTTNNQYADYYFTTGVQLRDFTGDGKLDIVAMYRYDGYQGSTGGPNEKNQLLFWRGHGDGTFDPLVRTDTGSNIGTVRSADFNSDGKADLLVERSNQAMGVMFGNGDGTFGAYTNEFIAPRNGGYFSTPAIADLDGKNGLDLAIGYDAAGTNIEVYLNDGTGVFTRSTTLGTQQVSSAGNAVNVVAGDFNGDGKADLFYTTAYSNSAVRAGLGVYLGAGDGTNFTYVDPTSGGTSGRTIVGDPYNAEPATPIDLNGDGKLDIYFGHVWNGSTGGTTRGVEVGLNNGDGTFRFTSYVIGDATSEVAGGLISDFAVRAGDYNRDGIIDLVVGTTVSGGSSRNVAQLTVLWATAPGVFNAPVLKTLLANSFRVASPAVGLVGDVNNDGIQDIVTGATYGGVFYTSLGNSNGSFGDPQIALNFPGQAIGGFLADLNHDGKLDLVWNKFYQGPNYSLDAGIHAALGNGDGTFTNTYYQSLGNYSGFGIVLPGDFNGDGYTDFAASAPSNYGYSNGFQSVFLYNPASPGTFTQSYLDVIPASSSDNVYRKSFAAGDFNGDGILDLVRVFPKDGSNQTPIQLQYYQGKGDGTFLDPTSTSILNTNTNAQFPKWLAAGDLNNDGKVDLILTSDYNIMSVFLGNGNGTFATPTDYAAGATFADYGQLYLKDFNRDGKLDLVSIGDGYGAYSQNYISVRQGKGDGTFGPEERYSGSYRLTSLGLADFNTDGKTDLIGTDFYGTSGIVYTGTKPGLAGVTNADVNGDGKKDLLAIKFANDHLKVLLGKGDNTFTRKADLLVGRGPVALATFDFDADGKLDVVTANRTDKSVAVLRGRGDGTFIRTDIIVGGTPVAIAVGDLTGDGRPDILVADDGSNAAYLMVNNGTGFDAPITLPLGDKPNAVIIADTTGDGIADAIFTLPGSKRIMILPGLGHGTFGIPIYVTLPSVPGGIAAGDFNGDGKLDLAVTFPAEGRVGVLYARGGGLFAKPQMIQVGANPTAISAQDVDGDGRIDLLVANAGDGTASVIYNKFDPTQLYRYTVAATDPDGNPVTFDLADAPGGMILNPTTGEIVWAPTADQLGTNTVTVLASDGQGGSATQTFQILVAKNQSNAAPVFTTTANPIVAASDKFTYRPNAIDTDNPSLRYRLVNGPVGARIDPTTGEVTWDARNQGLRFNNGADFNSSVIVTVPDSRSLHPASVTAEGWFQFDNSSRNQVLISKRGPNGIGYDAPYSFALQHIYGTLNARIGGTDIGGGTGLEAITPFTPEVGRWYHLAMSFDDATGSLNLLINGAVVATSAKAMHLSYDASPVYISSNNGSGQSLIGSATAVRLWNRARTQAEIRDDLSREVAPNAPGLIGDYRFNDGDAQTVRDSSTLGNHGRRAGNYWPTAIIGLAPEQTQSFTIRVEDGRGGSDEQSFNVTVVPPIRSRITGTITRGDTSIPLAGWLAYLDTNGDGHRSTDETTAMSEANGRYTFENLSPGSYAVRLDLPSDWNATAPTGGGFNVTLGVQQTSATNDFVIAPADPMKAVGPRFLPITALNATARRPLQIQALAVDPASRRITYSLAQAPAGMVIDPATGVLAWTPALTQVGVNRVIVKATNDRGSVDLLDFNINVSAPNSAPVITSTPPGVAFDGLAFRYDVSAQDAEQTALVFVLESAPVGAAIDAATGRVSWVPTSSQLGSQLFTIAVRDGAGGETRQSFTVTVTAAGANSAPVITAVPRTTAKPGLPYRGRVTASDTDGDPLTFALVSGPTGITVTADGSVNWTPTAGQLGDNAVTVNVTDGRGGTDQRTFNIAVTSAFANSAPAITTTPPSFTPVNRLFAYDLVASDANSDPVAFELVNAPLGMSLDSVRGTLRWTPAADQLGSTTITIRAFDPYGGEAVQSFVLTVRGANGPPAITSVPPTDSAVGIAYLYSVLANDAENNPLTYSLLQAPTGMAINAITGELSWTPAAGQLGPQAVIIQVSDAAGGFTTQGFAVNVLAGLANRAPVISTIPPLVASVGSPYSFAVSASDPEGGAVSYQLRRGPTGMTVDAITGVVNWTPTADQLGTVVVTFAAFDGAGAAGVLSFELSVLSANHAPTIVSRAAISVTAGAKFQYDAQATDADLDPLQFTLLASPAGMSIDAFGRIRWQTTPADIGAQTATIRVSDPLGGTAEQTFSFVVQADTTAPHIAVIPGQTRVAANSAEVFARYHITPFYPTNTVRISATDNVAVTGLAVTANGKSITLDALGNATFSFQDWGFGTIRVVATATDAAGNVGSGYKAFAFVPFGDDPAATSLANPVVVITSPSNDESTGGFVSIRGSASSDSFTGFKLSYRRADQSNYRDIASGTSKVIDGVLGKWDTSLLENDQYVLRLEELDEIAGTSVYEENIGVSGNLKLGNFRLSFADITIPVAGIPITLARTYDTLQADRTGDLGYGWRVDFRDTNLRTGLPKTGLEDLGIYSAFKPGTKVYLTLPGGERQGFTFTPDLRALPSFGGQPLIVATPRFTPDRGITSTLSIRGGTYILNQNNELTTLGGENYNPASEDFGGGYTLTLKDGTQYFIEGKTGLLQTVTDRNGNRLTFGDAGISSSTGVTATFDRDAKGRITRVTDPAGHSVNYTYDAKGDLVKVTDRMGNVTQCAYRTDRPHYLEKVIDPLGRTGARAEYGVDGRLAATFDADGKSIAFSYDPNHATATRVDGNGNPTVIEYDDNGNVINQTDALGGVIRSTYDDSNNLTSTTDVLGHTTRFTYDANRHATSVTDALGRTSFTSFGAMDMVLSTTDAAGNTTTNSYDRHGNLTQKVDALGHATTYQVDAAGNVLRVTDALGHTRSSTYDSAGNVTSQTDALWTTTRFAYDSVGHAISESVNVTTASGPVLEVTLTRFNANGDPTAVIDAAGNTTAYSYDAAGNRIGSTKPDGRSTALRYDSSNLLSGATTAGGYVSRFTYDGVGNRTSSTDAAGQTTYRDFDALGRLIHLTFPDATPAVVNPRRTFEYDALGRQTAFIDERGFRTTFGYDAADQLVITTDPLGAIYRYSYDAVGHEISETDPRGLTTNFRYDAIGELVRIDSTDGTHVEYAYDAGGNKTSSIDEMGRISRYQFDSASNLIRVTDGLGQQTNYTYDEIGNILSVVDANGHRTQFEYDRSNRKTATVDSLGFRSEVVYDERSQPIRQTDADGRTVVQTFNADGQVITRTFPDSSVTRFTYTPTGQVATMTDATGTTLFTYDVRDRLSVRTAPDGRTIQYGYDAAGNRTSITTPGGTTTFTFDARNRTATVSAGESGTTEFSYDLGGNLIRTLFADGTAESRTYDSRDHVSTVVTRDATDQLLLDLAYTLDASGLRIAVDETGTHARHVDYTYDAARRLTGETIDATRRINYTYDAAGNRLSRADSVEGTTVSSYDSNNRLLRETLNGTTTDYTYDSSGDMLSVATGTDRTLFTYDADHHLLSTTATASGNTHTATYRTTGDGLRVAMITDGVETRYLVDDNRPLSQVIEEYTPDGTLLAYSVAADALISIRRNDITTILHSDAQGTTRLGTVRGAETEHSAADAFGRVLESSAGANQLPGFLGRPTDLVSGLVDLRGREYNPRAGRFHSADANPIDTARPGDTNRYGYAANDPVNSSDPSGLFTLAEQLVSTGTASDLMRSYSQNLGSLLLSSIRISACVIKPGNQLRTMGARLIEDGVPRGEVMYDHGTRMIAEGLKSIESAIKKAYEDIGKDIQKSITSKYNMLGKPAPKPNYNTWIDDIENYYKKQKADFLKRGLRGNIEAGEKFAKKLGDYYEKLVILLVAGDDCERAGLLEKLGNQLIKNIPKA